MTATTTRAAAPAVHTPNRPARLNRSLLTLVGVILLLAGAYIVLRGLGLLGADQIGVLGLPGQDPQASLLPAGLAIVGWEPWVTAVAGVLVGLACLAWLAAQAGHRASAARWQLTGDRSLGSTTMGTDAAADQLATEIDDYTGVQKASAVITGDRTRPELHLKLTVQDQAPVAEIRDRIDTHAVPRLCQALELDTIPTEILIRLGTASSNRIR